MIRQKDGLKEKIKTVTRMYYIIYECYYKMSNYKIPKTINMVNELILFVE